MAAPFFPASISAAQTGLIRFTTSRRSSIGLDTIYRSKGQIPESFLRGTGLPENFITYMKSLTATAFHFVFVYRVRSPHSC